MISFKNRIFLLTLLTAVLILNGCSKSEPADPVPIETFQVVPSSDDVEDYLELLEEYEEETDQWFQVTSKEIRDKYDIRIFKSDTTCSSLLLYEGELYPLGPCLGGYGVTSFAVADLNEDGAFELYFTCSWGSGIPRSEIGYFDSAEKETVMFDASYWMQELLLEADDSDLLCVYDAKASVNSFVDIEMSPEEKVGSVAFDSGTIRFFED